MTEYERFIESKRQVVEAVGFDIQDEGINQRLFDWQRAIVRWALRRGRAALFEDCGAGKTAQQLEWAKHVCSYTDGNVLILAPLAVSAQTKREGEKFGIGSTVCRTSADIKPGINITNYERLHHFSPELFDGIILDESSILKNFSGVVRKQLTEFGSQIKFRLACTATPAPNDLIELTNHAEFLNVMTGKEIIALFFVQDGNTTSKWRLKGHARKKFWEWMAEWSVALRMPSDLGYDDGGFVLPPLNMHQVTTKGRATEGMLFPIEAKTLSERRAARRASMSDRVAEAAGLVNGSDDIWIVWCDLNAESEALTKAIDEAVEIRGSHSPEYKEKNLLAFADGEIKCLVSKPSIAGHGMNFQVCHKQVFVGLSDSYESLYQAIRRCWRFGQRSPVDVHVITSENEGAVLANIERKERQAEQLYDMIVKSQSVHEVGRKTVRDEMVYKEDVTEGEGWKLYLGDSCEAIKQVESNSVGLSVFSPPFPGMYQYSNSPRDVGNSETIEQMMDHFAYLMPDLERITMPGRMCCIHLCQLTAMLSRDGYIGLKDYRGRVIQAMQDADWIYAGEVTIDKNPQIQATRNKERGLLFKSLATDSSMMRMALADYLIYFRKRGANTVPIHAGRSDRYNNPDGWITEEEWIEWASPVWYRRVKATDGRRVITNYPTFGMGTDGIMETDVLNVACARESEDERHLCPLQLGVIERAVKLWSAPGDTVFSPFAGIGSEGYVSIGLDRRFIGIELKESYYRQAVKNLAGAVKQQTLAL
jgi:DNA modification methylase